MDVARPAAHRPDPFREGTGEKAPAKRPITLAPGSLPVIECIILAHFRAAVLGNLYEVDVTV